jgi:hypothetical protein
MHLDQELNVAANNIHSKEYSVIDCSEPYLFADYYDVKKGYLMDNLYSKGFVHVGNISYETDNRFVGFATGSIAGEFIALYSLHKQKIEECYAPKFSISCFLRIGTELFDLRSKNITIKWSNGLIKRKFQVLKEGKILHDYSYYRPWYYELFKGTQDQNLHGVYDFFSYVAWASKR